MTIAAAKKKLHDYIDHADEKKVIELLSLFESSDSKTDFVYDEETLNMLRTRSAEHLSGTQPFYTAEESLERARKHLNKNGI